MNANIAESLHPARLPTEFVKLGWDDLLAGFGLGLVLAALILTVLMPLFRKRPQLPGVKEQIRAAKSRPMPDRMLELVRLLAERGGTLTDEQRQALYTGELADPERLEAQIMKTRRGRR